jgi:hypothetical protein
MRKLPAIILFVLAGCDIGDDPIKGDEHVDAAPVPVTGRITADTTWMGAMKLTGVTEIAPMVTVTVLPGTTLEFAQGAGLRIEGALLASGTSGGTIIGKAETGATYWGPIEVNNGLARLTYVNFTGGGITTNGALASVEIVDSKMWKASGDYIIMNGGSINMQYSQLGPDDGETDTTHCQLHINTSTNVSIFRNNIAGAPFGLMFYGGVGSSFQLNNWYGNTTKDVDTKSGVEGNFSFSWFEKGPPTPGPGAMLTLENLATERIQQAGPRP